MSAETLRQAAALMRERAEAAHPSPWKKHHHVPGTVYTARAGYPTSIPYDKDAAHIASWHPAVALAVADWLDDATILGTCDACSGSEIRCKTAAVDGAIKCCPDCHHPSRRALAVARAYLGEDS